MTALVKSIFVRAEVRDIFKSQYGDQEASADEDRRRYESDVRQAMRNLRGANTEAGRNEDREEKTRKEKREGKKQRSRTRRSRNNSHNK